MRLSESQVRRYRRDGFLLIRSALPGIVLDTLEESFLALVEAWGHRSFPTAQSEDLAQYLLDNRELERKLYDGIREYPWLTEFGACHEIAGPVADLLGGPVGLMGKIPFRIDLPGVTRELAVWHQDYRYVRGNTDIVTAWVPMQDTPYARGCLMVMPGSHEMGALEHDQELIGKRHYPSEIFGREVRYVEMQRGDLLLFNALLLHSSGLNMSPTLRLSIQVRYSALAAPTDPAMGQVIPV